MNLNDWDCLIVTLLGAAAECAAIATVEPPIAAAVFGSSDGLTTVNVWGPSSAWVLTTWSVPPDLTE